MNRLFGFVKASMCAAIMVPAAPLGVLYSLTHRIHASGNGADAWATFAIGTISAISMVPLAVVGATWFLNPMVALGIYATWCVLVGLYYSKSFA